MSFVNYVKVKFDDISKTLLNFGDLTGTQT